MMLLTEKEGFLDYFNILEKFAFFQSFQKFEISLECVFLYFFEKGLDMYFHDVVYRKGSFLDHKNVIFT